MLVTALAAMDENASRLVREVHGRETLSRFDLDLSLGGANKLSSEWTQSLHNGFEIWWLAGMPLALVFLLTLVSMSVVAGMSGLEDKSRTLRVAVPLPAGVGRLLAWSSGWLARRLGRGVAGASATTANAAASAGLKDRLAGANVRMQCCWHYPDGDDN
jgi:hypothetical protein